MIADFVITIRLQVGIFCSATVLILVTEWNTKAWRMQELSLAGLLDQSDLVASPFA